MLTSRQTNVRKEVGWLLSLSKIKKGRKLSEKCFGLMLTRQTNVRKEVLF